MFTNNVGLLLNLPISVVFPQFKDQTFSRNDWGFLNFCVGPNGSGKSIFAASLKDHAESKNFSVRYLSAERLSGLEKKSGQQSGSSVFNNGFEMGSFPQFMKNSAKLDTSIDAFARLKTKPDLRIKIESILSHFFGKSLILEEEKGYLKPKLFDEKNSEKYDLKQEESHGLKEIIALLTIIHDEQFNFIIIDEPELHLHPQFQTFLLQEIRKLSGDPQNPPKKCFFIITHSPYFVDMRNMDDLKNCLVFHYDKVPTSVENFDVDDELCIKKFLPRLNTHHKQFFFSSRPIFVEGYRDQQIFSLIQEKREKFLGASGTSIIDLGGKNDLDVFFRLCHNLQIDAQFVCDLDVIFSGKLRQSVGLDQRCKDYLSDEGLGDNLLKNIGEFERLIDQFEVLLIEKISTFQHDLIYEELTVELKKLDDLKIKRYVILVAIQHHEEKINMDFQLKSKIDSIIGKLNKILTAFNKTAVHVLKKGELENYLPSYSENPYVVSDDSKSNVFENELEFLTNDNDKNSILQRYSSLISILDVASPSLEINIELFISRELGIWINEVQMAFNRGRIMDRESFEKDKLIDISKYSRIFELVNFVVTDSNNFDCTIKLTSNIHSEEKQIIFDQNTNPAKFRI